MAEWCRACLASSLPLPRWSGWRRFDRRHMGVAGRDAGEKSIAGGHPRRDLQLEIFAGAGLARAECGDCRGEMQIIACADAGCTYAPDWLKNLTSPLVAGEAEYGLGGSCLDASGCTAWDVASAPFFSIKLSPTEPTKSCTARSMAFTKELWQRIGGFPEHVLVGEDTLFDLEAGGSRRPRLSQMQGFLPTPQHLPLRLLVIRALRGERRPSARALGALEPQCRAMHRPGARYCSPAVERDSSCSDSRARVGSPSIATGALSTAMDSARFWRGSPFRSPCRGWLP